MNVKEIIAKYYQFANAGDWNAWCDLFAENVVLDEQLAGRIEGLAKLRPMMAGMKKNYSRFQNMPQKIVIADNEAAVVSHISAASASGAPVEAQVMNYFTIKDGKIAYMSNVHDSRPFDPVFRPEQARAAAS